jgi:hypothetical protein
MTISWNESAERPEAQPNLTIIEPRTTPPLPPPITGDETSDTFAPGTVYPINQNEFALTLEQDDTTVTYLAIPKGQGKKVTHEEFQAMIRNQPSQGVILP